ncbi:MAG: acyl-CoA dehydrogenase family protein [Acidimicrobiales bacterium]
MDFELSDELQALQETCRRIAQDKVKPRAREIDETGEYPQDLFEVFRDAGLLGLCIPTDLGGSGAGILGLTLAIEEVAKYSNTAALMLLLTRLPTGPVMIAGTREQNETYIAPIADGSKRGAFCLSEPQAGSDVMGMRTKAVQDGDEWVLNGTKCWISGVVQADWYTVFAKTSDDVTARNHDAITAFIVERSWDGVEVGSTDRKMGVRGVDTGELLLTNVRVPAKNVIGEVGGFQLAMQGLNSMRPIVAACGIGLRRGRPHVRHRVREGARQAARPSPTCRASSGRSPRWPPRSRRPGCSPTAPLDGRPRAVPEGARAVPLDGEVLRHRGRGEGLEHRPPDARRRRLHEGPHDRAVLPRRQAAHHRGGHQPGAAGPDRPGRAGPRPVVGLTVVA